MTDILDDTNKQIARRLAELGPLVEEHQRLQDAIAALDGIPAAPSGTSAPTSRRTRGRRGPGRPRGSETTATPAPTPAPPKPTSTAKPAVKRKRRRGRKPGGGKRARQALGLIRANPGITIPMMAEKMGIKTNYLYKVLPPLEQQGKIRKDGHGWFPEKA